MQDGTTHLDAAAAATAWFDQQESAKKALGDQMDNQGLNEESKRKRMMNRGRGERTRSPSPANSVGFASGETPPGSPLIDFTSKMVYGTSSSVEVAS